MLFAAVFMFAMMPDVHAQILKKLKKKIEKGVEQTVIDKTNEKVQHGVEQQMDKMLEGMADGQLPTGATGEMADMSAVADSYSFQYVYALEMTDESSGESTVLDMLLEPDADYWGMKTREAGEMTIVHDIPKSLMVMFMSQDGQNMAMAFQLDVAEVIEEETAADFEVREIPGKEIMGYDCNGFEVETDEYLVTVYNTFEAEVSLANVFGTNKDLPSNFDPKWVQKDGKFGLTLEMYMKDKTEGGNDVSMRCVKIEESPMTIQKADFESFAMPSDKQ
ncbi:hypothetical protein D3A96_11980 [Robertkochia marina]|nr:hypothetical protein D3A96_11980 [Robertkochia marina]